MGDGLLVLSLGREGLWTMYLHHRIHCQPLTWKAVSDVLIETSGRDIEALGGKLYGVWRSQIGRPRDELTAITIWPDDRQSPAGQTPKYISALPSVLEHETVALVPTLRPASPEAPRRQGNYAFRWFKTPARNWQEFLDLCAAAWPDFEASYDSQVIGLWRVVPDVGDTVRSLLVTRRPDLAMWERSKLPANEVEAEVRRKLSRRYDLCDDTVVSTSTLLTAKDRADTARWT